MIPSIYVESATVLQQSALEAKQFHLRLHAPQCASTVAPGNFIHLSCGSAYTLRRPFSVMDASLQEGTIDVLYKVVGEGTSELSRKQPGDSISCMGPIGNSFRMKPDKNIPVLVGGGVGIPPILFFARQLKIRQNLTPYVFMGSEIPYPFSFRPSRLLIDDMPATAIAAMSLLDDLGIPSRLSSKQDYSGSYKGYVHELVAAWLGAKATEFIQRVQIFACGPEPMLAAVAKLCGQYGIRCDLSLEEYMACAVGGCAGCTVKTQLDGQTRMQRVCVDGPVFDARSIYPKVFQTN